MINSIRFELKKLLKNKIFLTSVLILFLVTCLVTYYSNKSYVSKASESKVKIININKNEYKKYEYYSSYKEYEYQYKEFIKRYNIDKKISEYILKNDIDMHENTKRVFEKSLIILVFIMLPISIISSNAYSNEINSGSLKILLVKPYSRFKVFLSKIIAINIICFSLILLNIIFSSFFTLIFTKENLFSFASIVQTSKNIISVNYFLNYLLYYLVMSIPVFFICNLSLILSFVTSSTALSSGICIFLSLISLSISEFLFLIKLKFIEYTFLPYFDFTIFKEYGAIIDFNIRYGVHLSLNNGIIILLAYTIILYAITYYNFNNKDIH